MTAEILTIGDELLIGQVINTNQAFLAQELNNIGIVVVRMNTVGDLMQAILESFADAWKRSNVVVVTGGLGPTHDDVTKKALCTFFNTELVSNVEARARIERFLQGRRMSWTPAAEEQTMLPKNATVIPNPIGTASGMLFQEDEKYFFALPGVPYEMKEIVRMSVVPYLSSKVTGSYVKHLTLRTTGIAESILAQQLGDLEPILQGAALAFLPSPRGVRLRITVLDRTSEVAGQRVREVEARIRGKVEKYIYGTGEEELEEVLGRILTEKGFTLAIAESCTGGLIADRITNVSGSSNYFERGVVTYSNKSKTDLLGVPTALIGAHGAVSRQVAEAMASGVRRMAGASIGLSTTGIAGPTGGTPEKPVGLVWIGYADRESCLAVRFNFGEGRILVKERASQAALELVRRKVLKLE